MEVITISQQYTSATIYDEYKHTILQINWLQHTVYFKFTEEIKISLDLPVIINSNATLPVFTDNTIFSEFNKLCFYACRELAGFSDSHDKTLMLLKLFIKRLAVMQI